MSLRAKLDLPKRSLRFDLIAAVLIAALTLFGASRIPERPRAGFFDRLRQSAVVRLEDALDPPLSAWASGLLLGDDSGFSDRWRRIFRATGTTHLTAVSGYNVSLVLSAAWLALRRAPVGRLARAALGLGSVVAFVLLTGHPSSVVRAALMAGLIEIARAFGRPLKPLRALLLAALIASIASPGILARDLGFQLSLAATFGLAAVAPTLRETIFKSWPGESAEWASQTAAATVMTAPLIARLTGEYSLAAFAANLLMAACVPILMAVSAAALVASLMSDEIGRVVGFLAAPFLGAPLLVLRALASAPHAALRGVAAFAVLAAVQAAMLVVIFAWRRRAARRHPFYVQEV